MNDPRSTEQTSLAGLATVLTFPYIWLGLFLLLTLMYGANFFGRTLSGDVVAGLVCCALLNPFVPGLLSGYVVRPLFLSLLQRGVVNTKAWFAGLFAFVATWVTALFFISRSLQTSLILFLAAPLIGVGLAAVVTMLDRPGRTGGGDWGRPTISGPPASGQRSLPRTPGQRPLLPGRRPSSLPGSRSSSTGSSSGRVQRPRRRE